MKTVGIVGLGLIGGSMAKAYAAAGWRVLGDDRDQMILDFCPDERRRGSAPP